MKRLKRRLPSLEADLLRLEVQKILIGEMSGELCDTTPHGVIADNINRILEASYRISVDPLPGLRDAFPVFSWHHTTMPVQDPTKAKGDVLHEYNSAFRSVIRNDVFWLVRTKKGSGFDIGIGARLNGNRHDPFRFLGSCSFVRVPTTYDCDWLLPKLLELDVNETLRPNTKPTPPILASQLKGGEKLAWGPDPRDSIIA